MTSKERIMAAVAHRPVDRIPVDFKAREDVKAALMAHLGLDTQEQLMQKLGADMRVVGIREHHAAYASKTNGILAGASENAGGRYLFHGDGTYENAWGVVYRISRDGLYDEWVSGPFAREPDLDAFPWPGMDIYEDVESIRPRVEAYGGQYAILGPLSYPFKVCWQMRGMEDYFCDMVTDEAFAIALWEKAASYERERGLRLIRAGVDIIAFYGDIAMQDRLMYSLDTWRRIDKPIFARLIADFKAENPEVLVYYHSDGNMEEVLEDLIEIGVDMVNPIQPECMDVARVKRQYGDRIAIHGTISIQETLPGPIEGVRREVEERKAIYGDGGLILCPSNLIQMDTPMENIVELYRAAGSLKE